MNDLGKKNLAASPVKKFFLGFLPILLSVGFFMIQAYENMEPDFFLSLQRIAVPAMIVFMLIFTLVTYLSDYLVVPFLWSIPMCVGLVFVGNEYKNKKLVSGWDFLGGFSVLFFMYLFYIISFVIYVFHAFLRNKR